VFCSVPWGGALFLMWSTESALGWVSRKGREKNTGEGSMRDVSEVEGRG